MFRVVAVALVCVVASGIAAAQQSKKPDDSGGRQARKGESCLSFHRDCGQWCDANQAAAGKASCRKQCDDYQSACLSTGVWKTALARGEIRGLPPN